jgi:hypothetical protein
MRVTLAILGLFALLIVAAQTFRHVYVRWVEPRDSVLDQFREKTEQEIAASKTLEELAALYSDAKKLVQAEDAKHAEDTDSEADYRRRQREPYTSEELLRGAITERESHERLLQETHFFWWVGFGCALLGFIAYFHVHPWFGVSLMVVGMCEIIWATCPSFRSFGAAQEFDRLLTAKVVYSALSVALVLIAWRFIVPSLGVSRKTNA